MPQKPHQVIPEIKIDSPNRAKNSAANMINWVFCRLDTICFNCHAQFDLVVFCGI